MRFSTFASLLSVLALAGCGHADNGGQPGTTTTTTTGTSCASLAETCANSQQGCTEDASGAHCVACDAGTYAVAARASRSRARR